MGSRVNSRAPFLFVVVGLVLAGLATQVGAQSPDELWAEPVNLSRSGAASEAQLVVDSNGLYHLLWLDAFDGLVHIWGDGGAWSDPVAAERPFQTRAYYPDLRDVDETPLFVPRLVANLEGRLVAFWLDEENTLFSSSVEATQFDNFGAWSLRRQIVDSVLTFDVAVGANGGVHLAALRSGHTSTLPAGIYTYRSTNGGLTWSAPVPVYQTIYFRLLNPEEGRLAVATTDNGWVHVVWDDPRLESVLYSRSEDGGLWDDPQKIVARETENEKGDEGEPVRREIVLAMPENLTPEDSARLGEMGPPSTVDLVVDSSDRLHLVWQVAGEGACVRFHQASSAGGSSWEAAVSLPGERCPQVQQLIPDHNGRMAILSDGDGSALVSVWESGWWSEPYSLPVEFTNPETGRLIDLDCIGAAPAGESDLLFIYSERTETGDIWVLSPKDQIRFVIETPVPTPTPMWTGPVRISSDPVDARQPAIAADSEGHFHLVWSQPSEGDSAGLGQALYYAWGDREGFSWPVTLFSFTGEKAEQSTLAIDSRGFLHLVWNGGESGTINYSTVFREQASVAGIWAPPIVLSDPLMATSWPSIALGRNGQIHLTYAVPLNEGRGIYYVHSDEDARNWSDPVSVFDAVEEGWARVDQPVLAIGIDGALHIAWSRQPLPGSLQTGGIYYSRSEDGGVNWTDSFELVRADVDRPQLTVVKGLEVHVLWEEKNEEERRMHRWSVDGGRTWSLASEVTALEGVGGWVGMAIDVAERLHLAAVAWDQQLEGVPEWLPLQHYLWEGESWVYVGGGTIPSALEDYWPIPLHTSLAVASGDRLGLAYRAASDEEGEGAIYFLSRSVDLPEYRSTPLPTLTPTSTATPKSTSTPQPTPTATVDLSTGGAAEVQVGGVGLSSSWAGAIVGAVPAVLMVLVVLIVGVWTMRYGFKQRR